MNNSTTSSPAPSPIKSLRSSGPPNGGKGTGTGAKEPQSVYGPQIAQTAFQSIGMSTKDFAGPLTGPPEYALALSIIFTRATEQTIMLGTEPGNVRSTSILWNSLIHDSRFKRVAMSEAAPGDIVIESGWHQAGGFAGIVVDHGRIISMGTAGTVQDNCSLFEIQRNRQEMALFRYIGVQGSRSYPLANAGYNPDEPRLPAGQHGGGQWTSAGVGGVQNAKGQAQMATSTMVLSGENRWTAGERTSDTPAPDTASASPSNGSKAYFVNKTLSALAMKKPDGSAVIVMTKIKTQEQADLLGVTVGADVPIFVPPGKDPQAMVDLWHRRKLKTPIDFYEAWKPGGPNDYKKKINPIYDSYGNFEYGAAGAAYGFTRGDITGMGEIAALYRHHALNNPINRADIAAGYDVISGGGKLLTIPYKWVPSIGAKK